MLTKYDEFPVHQHSRPFSEIPSTDYGWDDGYFFGLYSADVGAFFFSGMRVSPNTDMIGGYAGLAFEGRQYTTRFSRPWRADVDTNVGPLVYDFVKPLEVIRLALAENESDLNFDFEWIGVGAVYEEPHHLATSRCRRTTDQTRYYQSGTGRGWIQLRDRRFEFGPGDWWGSRDHSWGIYNQRPPLAPEPRWLPPVEEPEVRRGFRWASWWGSSKHSGFFSVHESEDGERVDMNDVFGTPLEGGIDIGSGGDRRTIVDARHRLQFHPGTRALSSGAWELIDNLGGTWTQVYERVPSGCWLPATIGYWAGSWKDGGTMFTYHGTPGLVQECDEFDFSDLIYDHTLYNGEQRHGLHSYEHLGRVTTTDPDGEVSSGSSHMEVFIPGRYSPYGFEHQVAKPTP
jgi:hypothetical protein